MKNSMYRVLGLVVLFGALFALGWTKEASAGVQVNINIVAPPPLQFAAPPDVYVVPSGSSYVYMVPDYDGVYFYGGYWYRFYNDHWFRSSHYNERWDYIEMSNVPQVIIVVPPEYIHYVPSGYYRIHYDDFYSNWQSWDHGRHWDSYDWYQHESRDDVRRERYNSIESYHQQGHQQQNVQSPQHQQSHQQQNVQSPQHQQGHQQKNVQSPQHQQGHQQQNVQNPKKQKVQTQQKQNSQKPQQHDDQKSQQHDGQHPQQQQGEKEHGGNK